MGLNISGIAINKNYENDFESLKKEFGWNLKRYAEIDFETASSNWTKEGVCDVYFSEKGTLIFISMEMCGEPWGLENENTLAFVFSEMTMTFNINYCESGIKKRSLVEFDGQIMENQGEKLESEDRLEDISEVILNQIEVLIGKDFWEIEPEEKAVRYIFSKAKMPEPKTENPLIESEIKKEINVGIKKWWQFWK